MKRFGCLQLFMPEEVAAESWKKGSFSVERDSLERKIKKLRKDFQKNVQPALRRHTYYLSKSERRRIKRKKAIKRIQRRQRRYRSAA